MAKHKSVSALGELTTTRILPCILTEEEFAQKGKDLADLLQEIYQAEEEKKAAAADANGKIKEMEVAAQLLTGVINGGTEEREVECLWRKDTPKAGMMSLFRQDTQKFVEKKEMELFDGGSGTNPLSMPPQN